MNKKILIINEYAGSPYHGMEYRHYYFAKELIKQGFNVTIISASYSHLFSNPPKVKRQYEIEFIDGIKYIWIKVPKYNSSIDKKRILKWFVFSFKLLFLYKTIKKIKPDLIMVSVPQLLPIVPSFFISKILKSKFILEIRDIWPLSIIELGNYSKNHLFIKLLKYFEILAIKKSNLICSVLPGYGQYLKEQGFNKDFLYIPNGINIDEMNKSENLEYELEQKIPKNKFIVGYAGTIGLANCLDSLIEASILLKDYEDLFWVIVGDGPAKENLIKKTSKNNNIIFLPKISIRQINSLLNKFDLCYLGAPKRDLYSYGVSPNKIFDYMYAAKPIIEAYSTKFSLIESANCGIRVEPENSYELSEAILKIYRMPKEEREKLGINGRNFVLQNHTYDKIVKKFIHRIYKIV